MKKELTSQEVKFNFKFKKNKEKGSGTNIPEIDQEYEKIRRALNIKKDGYNIYLIDSFSKEKLNKLQDYIKEQYKYLQPPKDICYVVLDDYKKPEVLFVFNGNGNKLKEVVEEIKENYMSLVEEFYNSSKEDEKDELIEEIQNKRNSYVNELMEMAKKENFEVKVTNKGFAFIPLINGKVISEREYDNLDKEKKEIIVAKATILKKKAEIVLGKIKEIEVKSITKLKEVYVDFLAKEMEDYKDEILFKFIDDDCAYEYLEKLFVVIEKDIIDCYTMDIDDDEEKLYEVINKYSIQVLVDNSYNNNPPIIYEEDPSFNNLMGSLEYENHNGVYTTDISLINAGSLLKANEGCLIIRMSSLASNGYSYYYLKKALITNKVIYDASKSYLDIISINTLKPKAIPINVKVILIGDMDTYDTLYNLDEDFSKLFPLRAEFYPIVDSNNNSMNYINDTINKKINENSIMPITDEGINEIIKYLSRSANRKTKINIDIAEIDKVIILANYNAKKRNSLLIEVEDIREFVYYKERIEEEYDKLYEENKIILSVTGEKVGVINGLSVLDTGYHSFGKPVRITCVTHKGSGRIIDIHKESKLSGKIHEKSINIIRGLISNIVDSYEEIPVDFYLNFEQSYGIIDGDSASVAEIICMLSALTKKPIKQSISVTGSINQLGEVQAIGGVNEKIEGFFKVCESIDKYKNKGVLIPLSNKDELILMPEVEKAVEDGDFHIYVMETLDDAIEILILNEDEKIEDFYSTLKEEIKKYKTKK